MKAITSGEAIGTYGFAVAGFDPELGTCTFSHVGFAGAMVGCTRRVVGVEGRLSDVPPDVLFGRSPRLRLLAEFECRCANWSRHSAFY